MDKVEELIRELRDEYSGVRKAAAKALGDIGDSRAVEPLIQTLRDKDSDVRKAAAEALEKIEPEWYKTEVAKKQVPEFINALRHWDPDVRRAAAKALEKIEPEWYKTEAAGRQVPEFVKILVKAKDEEYCNYLKKLIEKIFLSHKLFLDSYPYLFCKNYMLKAEKRKVRLGLFKRHSYVVCRGCGTAEALIIGIKKVVGIIGGNINNYSIDGDTAYVRLWFEKEKSARNADIDMLLITGSEDIKDENEYDKAINTVYDVLVNDRSRSRKYIKKIPVLIQGNLPLSIRAKRVLENEFGGVTHM